MDLYNNQALLTDYYELTMAQGYFDSGRIEEQATFELFYRSNPFEGGYAVLAGVGQAIEYLRNYSFNEQDIEYLKQQNDFTDDFLDYLADLEFTGQVKGIPEGSVIFPYEPIMQVTGPIALVQLVESALLNIINYQTLIATKAARITYSTKRKDTVLEFGLRRAHGDGAMVGARAAMIGGCVGSSNTLAGKIYDLPVSGTQAHSWVQSFPSELEAFQSYATTYPENTILLVDTYDTLESGVPNAIKVAKEMEERGEQLRGIRIDSGDLAWFAIESAKLLDDAGLEYVDIVLSSDLDEYVIQSIVDQIIGGIHEGEEYQFRMRLLDRLLWGVGTNLITGSGGEKAALGGVYKLVQIDDEPVIKISENRAKTTNPGRKHLWRVINTEGNWVADVMGLIDEEPPSKGDTIHHPSDPSKTLTLGEVETIDLHIDLLDYYESDHHDPKIWKEAKNRCDKQLFNDLDKSHLRFLNPHIYRVSLTEQLFNLKQRFIERKK